MAAGLVVVGALVVAPGPPARAAGTGTLSLYKAIENLDTGSGEGDRWKWDVRAEGGDYVFQEQGLNGFQSKPIPSGKYTISEVPNASTPAGYRFRDWNCDGTIYQEPAPSITLAEGQDLKCTVTNVAVHPTLTLRKVVVGDAPPSAWTLTAHGPTTVTGPANSAAVTNQRVRAFQGTYTLSESGGPPDASDYVASPWACRYTDTAGGTGELPVDGDGRVTIGLGQDVTCTITNSGPVRTAARLTLVKAVAPPAPGDPAVAAASAFTLTATPPAGPPIAGTSGAAEVSGAPVEAGVPYTLSENGPAGYTASAWTCVEGDGLIDASDATHVTLAAGADATCTITNTFTGGWLTLVKEVVGSDVPATAWTLTADGSADAAGTTVSGATGSSGTTAVPVPAGSYDLSEVGPMVGFTTEGYVCTGSEDPVSSVEVRAGESITCTVTNTARSPVDATRTRLTLVKAISPLRPGDPAVASPGDFTLAATAPGQAPISGAAGSAAVTAVEVEPDVEYTLSEDGPAGYSASQWLCIDKEGLIVATDAAHVTLAAGADATCTITNTFTGGWLTLVSTVVTGGQPPTAWTLSATGTGSAAGTAISGVTGSVAVTAVPVRAGRYDLDESGPAGYAGDGYVCTGGHGPVTWVEVAAGVSVVCVTAHDVAQAVDPPSVVPDSGGTGGSGLDGTSAVGRGGEARGAPAVPSAPTARLASTGTWAIGGSLISLGLLCLGIGALVLRRSLPARR